MKPVATKKLTKIMPEGKWYLSQRGMKASETAFGRVAVRKKQGK